jgi:hypothetical protein
MVVTELHLPPRVVTLRARRQRHRDRRAALQAVIDEEAVALAIEEDMLAIEDEAKDDAIHREQLRLESLALQLQQKLAEVRARGALRLDFLGPPVVAGTLAFGAVGSWAYFADNPVGLHYGAMLGLVIPTALLFALFVIGPWLVLSLLPLLARGRDEERTLREIEQLECRKTALACGDFVFDCHDHPGGVEYFKINYDVSSG